MNSEHKIKAENRQDMATQIMYYLNGNPVNLKELKERGMTKVEMMDVIQKRFHNNPYYSNKQDKIEELIGNITTDRLLD